MTNPAVSEPCCDNNGLGTFSAVALQVLCGLLYVAMTSSTTCAADVVKATIEKESAWTGEAVPLIITLYSPGPFSGTAHFDFPPLSKTMLIRSGNPVVGSENIGDDSFMTQRHEFSLYTQNHGEIVVPPFRVRFSGKPSFISEPEPIEGFTAELRFQSKRPPGTEELGVVVAATSLDVTQTWQQTNVEAVQAGDVIERTITLRATGTTAMMLTPLISRTPEGVRLYATDPILQDRNDRGTSTAERSDTVKYQFEKAGTYELPEMSLAWWNVQMDTLVLQTLPGETINVIGGAATPIVESQDTPRSSSKLWFLAIGVIALLALEPLFWCVNSLRARFNHPENVAVRVFIHKCRANDAAAAYVALLAWKRAASQDGADAWTDLLSVGEEARVLQVEWDELSRYVFHDNAERSSWSGQRLADSFVGARRLQAQSRRGHRQEVLPVLNPTQAPPLLE